MQKMSEATSCWQSESVTSCHDDSGDDWSITSEGAVSMRSPVERSQSSMSARASRIPRLTRSFSLRENPPEHRAVNSISPRSSTNSGTASAPKAPENDVRRRPNCVNINSSLCSRKQGTADRKTHSYAGVIRSLQSVQNACNSNGLVTVHSRNGLYSCHSNPAFRHSFCGTVGLNASLLPVSPSYPWKLQFRSSEGDKYCSGNDDDNESEKSYGSAGSAISCDVSVLSRGGGLWNGKKPKNVLHCRHTTELDPDSYLTPTQRAARRIRDLKHHLKEARQEIAQKDAEIARLTKELVQLRLEKVHSSQEEDEKSSRKTEVKANSFLSSCKSDELGIHLEDDACLPHMNSAYSAYGDTDHVVPPLDVSEPELDSLRFSPHGLQSQSGAPDGIPASPTEDSIPDTADSNELSRSLADSGHYDDLPSQCSSSKNTFDRAHNSVQHFASELGIDDEETIIHLSSVIRATENRIRVHYEQKIEELKRNQMNEYHELKEKYNDHVETLLNKLSDANLRYFELRPQYDSNKEKLKALESEVESLKEDLQEAELRHQKMYLHMYLKGQQASRFAAESECSVKSSSGYFPDLERHEEALPFKTAQSKISTNGVVVSLMRQLTQAEEELEKLRSVFGHDVSHKKNLGRSSGLYKEELDPVITLQFLKSAVYYFFTDKENSRGHLRAIESILGFTQSERAYINRHIRV